MVYAGAGYQFFEDSDAFEQLAWTAGAWRSLRLGAIWAVVLVNLRGVKEAGLFSQVTTTRS
jgi:hypothetical protein